VRDVPRPWTNGWDVHNQGNDEDISSVIGGKIKYPLQKRAGRSFVMVSDSPCCSVPSLSSSTCHVLPAPLLYRHNPSFFVSLWIYRVTLADQTGSPSLDSLDLRLRPWHAVEARGQLVAVEELAGLRLHGTQGGARLAADGTVGEGGQTAGGVERAVLLSLGAVGREGVRQDAGGRGGVGSRSVVDGLCETELN